MQKMFQQEELKNLGAGFQVLKNMEVEIQNKFSKVDKAKRRQSRHVQVDVNNRF